MKNCRFILSIVMLILFVTTAATQPLPNANPEKVGMSSTRLVLLDSLIQNAIEKEEIPGAAILVARKGKIIIRKTFGFSQLIPEKKPMKIDQIFDMASITKPIATATSIMMLVEQGRIRLWDKVKQCIPEFSTYSDEDGKTKRDVRIWHLLTHTSGLLPYTNADEAAKVLGRPCDLDSMVVYIAKLKKTNPPGEEFHYSCLGFITLANILKKITGLTVAEFSAEHIFKPLKMKRTFYTPPKKFKSLCVPTEVIEGEPLIGNVHDPLARLQSGISGNAGLFSTVDDLAIFAQMMLNRGVFNNVRILSPLTVERMTELYPGVEFAGRGLGWDLNSAYSTNGGDLFGPKSYGHSGYTGTSIWIDPETETFVILLTNQVHPNDKGSVVPLKSKVANVVASSIFEL